MTDFAADTRHADILHADTLHHHACAFLSTAEPLFTPYAIGPAALPPLVLDDRTPYEALMRAIAHQQLHGKAAEAILGRLIARVPDEPFPSPQTLLSLPETDLRTCGFSAGKIASLRDIAAKAVDGTVPDRQEADTLTDEQLIARLTSLRGVGRWTVEMLLIFTLGRQDVLPVDDFGVRQGWKVLTKAEAQLKPRALAAIGEAWSPHRSVAARLLWQAADQNKLRQQNDSV